MSPPHPPASILDPPPARPPGFDIGHTGVAPPIPCQKTGIMALPLAPAAPQGCVALRAPVLRTPLPRAGFAVAGVSDGRVEQKGN